MPTHIGTLAEKSLHAQLKQLYAAPGDLLEHSLDGYVVDIARPLAPRQGPTTIAASRFRPAIWPP